MELHEIAKELVRLGLQYVPGMVTEDGWRAHRYYDYHPHIAHSGLVWVHEDYISTCARGVPGSGVLDLKDKLTLAAVRLWVEELWAARGHTHWSWHRPTYPDGYYTASVRPRAFGATYGRESAQTLPELYLALAKRAMQVQPWP